MLKSLYSGILARKISVAANFADNEEAYICSLFHNFGKVLASFALPEKIEEIKFISLEQGISEDAAALSVLGARYEEIGMEMAGEWDFPEKIIHSMHKVSEMEIRANAGENDKLNSIAFFANSITEILATGAARKDMVEKIDKLVITFKAHFGMLYGTIASMITASFDNLHEFSGIFNVDSLQTVSFNRQFLTWANKAGKSLATSKEAVPEDFNTELIKTIDIIFESERMFSPESIFAKGIQDINSAILGNFSLNDIMRIVLETMYRGMQLSGEAKALFLIKDTKSPTMSIRFGFGSGIEELKKWFNIPLGDPKDIFNIAIAKKLDLVMKDIEPQAIRQLLPEWFKGRVFEKIFIVLLPILINNKPIGMFYVEGDREGFEKISGSHLNYLRILRDQTVMAIKQKQF